MKKSNLAFRALFLASLLLLSLMTGCPLNRLLGNAEPYGHKPSLQHPDASGGSSAKEGFECVDPTYRCRDMESPRMRLDERRRAYLGDNCYVGARPLTETEVIEMPLIAGVRTVTGDRCIYVDPQAPPLPSGAHAEVFCASDNLNIFIQTDNQGQLQGLRADRDANLSVAAKSGKVYRTGTTYEGNGFVLHVEGDVGTLEDTSTPLKCRARPY